MHAGNARSADATRSPTPEQVRRWLERVTDPEIPVLTIGDLGILRDVRQQGEEIEIVITPTYSGCPAMRTIEQNIREELSHRGIEKVRISTRLAPPWTTDWLSTEGRRKLLDYGIAPPTERSSSRKGLFGPTPAVGCPQCGSMNTARISEFGSTACKALYKCNDCLEPFDYFKCL